MSNYLEHKTNESDTESHSSITESESDDLQELTLATIDDPESYIEGIRNKKKKL